MSAHRKRTTQGVLVVLIFALTACRASGSSPTEPALVPTIALPSPSPDPSPLPTPFLPTPTQTSTSTPTATRTPTPIPLSSSTPVPWTSRRVIGRSVQGRTIEVVRFGLGPRWFVVVGAIHGGRECNTHALVERLVEHIAGEPTLLPPDVTLYLVPLLNPDGCALETRFNAREVDLNRNWETQDWTTDAQWSGGTALGSGGVCPFSEPETDALQAWLLALRDLAGEETIRGIFYHSAVPPTGLAQPGFGQTAKALARVYAEATGYRYSTAWVGDYVVTGGAIRWASDHGLAVINVELPDRGEPDTIPSGWSETHVETNLRGLLAAIRLTAPDSSFEPQD